MLKVIWNQWVLIVNTDNMELNIDIKNWPLDLLVDYVLKIYHRNALEMYYIHT